MNDSVIVVGLKNYYVRNSDVGVLRPWRNYYQKYRVRTALQLGEREAVDCLERAAKKAVLIRPTHVLGK